MPLVPTRVVRTFKYAVNHDGIDDYSVIQPFIVYGWPEITIEEWIYVIYPKASPNYSVTSIIGEPWVDYPATANYTLPYYYYNYFISYWKVRTEYGWVKVYSYQWFTKKGQWMHLIRRFTASREYSVWINGDKEYYTTVPSTERTVLEWNPDTATYPERYKRFIMGAGHIFTEWTEWRYAILRIYRSALTDDQIMWNRDNPDDPVSNDLEVSLYAHPDHIRDIDNDGILEWIDLSGKGHHAKLYGARLVELVKEPARVLSPARVLAPAR